MSKRMAWEPVPMGEIVLVDPDDSQLGDTIIVDATGCFMRVCEDRRQAEVWLPDTLRLCRQVESDAVSVTPERAAALRYFLGLSAGGYVLTSDVPCEYREALSAMLIELGANDAAA